MAATTDAVSTSPVPWDRPVPCSALSGLRLGASGWPMSTSNSRHQQRLGPSRIRHGHPHSTARVYQERRCLHHRHHDVGHKLVVLGPAEAAQPPPPPSIASAAPVKGALSRPTPHGMSGAPAASCPRDRSANSAAAPPSSDQPPEGTSGVGRPRESPPPSWDAPSARPTPGRRLAPQQNVC